ncbi:MAG: hypothetical protein AAFP68_08275 [Pseudomonadota bacterium]
MLDLTVCRAGQKIVVLLSVFVLLVVSTDVLASTPTVVWSIPVARSSSTSRPLAQSAKPIHPEVLLTREGNGSFESQLALIGKASDTLHSAISPGTVSRACPSSFPRKPRWITTTGNPMQADQTGNEDRLITG